MVYIKKWSWSSLVAQWLRTPHFHCQVLGSIRAQGTDILANGIARKLKKSMTAILLHSMKQQAEDEHTVF